MTDTPAPASRPDDLRFRRVVESLVGAPIVGGNSIEVLRNGDEIFPAMLTAVREAERRIDMVTYVYWTGDIADELGAALCERARAGVDVRLLLDAVGSVPMLAGLVEELRDAGVQVEFFRPPARLRFWEIDNRTHRKVLVCDGRVAFTGGVGIAAQWEGDARTPEEWRDTHFRVTGPAVDGLHACFVSDWQQTVQVVSPPSQLPDAPEPTGDADLAVVDDTPRHGRGPSGVLLRGLLEQAQRRVRVATPYFNPTEDLHDLLADLARRGVEVEVLVPGKHLDKRVSGLAADQHLCRLTDVGVRIRRYQPTMLHTKVLLVDDAVAVVGSHNFNRRSLSRDAEVALVVFHPPTIERLGQDLDDDLAASGPWQPAARGSWRWFRQAIGEKVIAPIRAQL